ncbi:MAG: SIS domain-containing protein [Dehalococcoidales bacterium]|jgi:D-sedoheptulose 7-phosphate isomerase
MALIEEYLAGLQECLEELSTHDIEEAANIIFDAYRKRKRIFIMGNGGSATTAIHFARDLQIGTAVAGKPRVRANCIADNMAFITSLANDIGYDRIFEEQLIDQLVKGDVVIGISASGNSPNVLRAIEYARKNGAVTIGFIGFGGGKLKDLADKSIVLSKKNYQQVEDAHMVLAHIIPCRIKEKIEAL